MKIIASFAYIATLDGVFRDSYYSVCDRCTLPEYLVKRGFAYSGFILNIQEYDILDDNGYFICRFSRQRNEVTFAYNNLTFSSNDMQFKDAVFIAKKLSK